MPNMPKKDADGDYDAGRCTPTTCPKPHHATPHAPTSHPPRQHGNAGMSIQPAKQRGGSDRGGY